MVAAFLIPQVHFVAGAAPILFPNVVILFLQSRGKLISDDEKVSHPKADAPGEDEDPEDRLNSFEV